MQRSFGNEAQSRNIPQQVMDGIAGCKNYGAPGSERQTHKALTGDLQARFRIRGDLHDTPRSGQGSCNVHVPVSVEGQPLWPPQSFIERAHVPARVNFIDPIVGTSDKQVSMRPESQVVRRNTHLQGGEDKHLLIGGDLEDGAVAVAHVETSFTIKSDAGGYSEALREGALGAVRSHLVDGAIESRRDIHLSLVIECNGGGVHHLPHERFDVVVGVDLEDGDWDLLSARSRKRGVNVAFRVEGRIGDGMQVLRDSYCDLHRVWVALVSVCSDDHGSGHVAFWNTRDQKSVGTHHDRGCNVAEFHFGPQQVLRAQPGAVNPNLAPGKGE